MVTKLYTEAELDALRSIPKRITNPGARWLEKPKGRPAHLGNAAFRPPEKTKQRSASWSINVKIWTTPVISRAGSPTCLAASHC